MRDQIAVLGLAEGFFQSNVLFALIKLRIFELIGDGEKPLAELASQVGAQANVLARLLNAGVVLKLLETRDGVSYRLSPLSQSVLAPAAGPHYLGNWVLNLSFFERALSKLDEAVVNAAPTVDPTAHFGGDPELTRVFSLAMHDYASLRGKDIGRYFDTSGCETLLDLGCGHGAYAFQLGIANPSLKLFLLDSKEVLEVAKKVSAEYPLTNEVTYVPADALRDEIDGQYDVILISNALHAMGPAASRALIGRLYNSVKQGGSLVIQGQFLRDDRRGERWPVMLDLIQLCITPAGANHSVEDGRSWLEEAGFRDVEHRPMSLFNTNSLIRGYKR